MSKKIQIIPELAITIDVEKFKKSKNIINLHIDGEVMPKKHKLIEFGECWLAIPEYLVLNNNEDKKQ